MVVVGGQHKNREGHVNSRTYLFISGAVFGIVAVPGINQSPSGTGSNGKTTARMPENSLQRTRIRALRGLGHHVNIEEVPPGSVFCEIHV